MSRPSKLTPELRASICADIRRGFVLEEAAAAAGISARTLHRWMARGERDRVGAYRAFYTEVDAALRGTRDALLATVRRASRYDGRAAAYLLSRSFDRVRAARPRRAPNGVSEAIDRMLEGGPAPTTRRAGGE